MTSLRSSRAASRSPSSVCAKSRPTRLEPDIRRWFVPLDTVEALNSRIQLAIKQQAMCFDYEPRRVRDFGCLSSRRGCAVGLMFGL